MSNQPDQEQKLVKAYESMLKHVRDAISSAEKTAMPKIQELIENAGEKISTLEEITLEEAQKIGDYIKRDIKDAAEHLDENEDDLKAWFKFDMEQIESRLLEWFSAAADQTKIEMNELQDTWIHTLEYKTGEITGPGTLYCEKCNHPLHFHKAGHIPPCPNCHHTLYRRLPAEE